MGLRQSVSVMTALVVVATSFAVFADDLERPSPRQGYHFGVGVHLVGAKALDRDVNNLRMPRTIGPKFSEGLSLKVGQGIHRRLDVGLTVAIAPGDISTRRLSAFAQAYPLEHGFVRGELGVGTGTGGYQDRYGATYVVGVGHDFYLSNNRKTGGWLVAAVANVAFGPDRYFRTRSVSVGIELSKWWGHPRSQLALDAREAYQ